MPAPTFHRVAARAGRTLFLVLLLAVWPRHSAAQSANSPFEDTAARAAAARDQHNLALAIQLYGQAEQLKPDWVEGWWYLGLLNYSANQYPAAIDAFNHFLQLQPTAAPGMALRGLCEFETGALDDSLRDLQTAVDHGAANDPRNAQIIRYHLALLLAHAGRFQEALDQYKFFATTHIESSELLLSLGLAGLRNTAFPQDVPASDHEKLQAVGQAGYVLLSGEQEKAASLFEQLFARYTHTPGLHYFDGFLLVPHDPGLAVEQFQQELAVSPSDNSARSLLAYTLMILGRYPEALPEAERLFAQDSSAEITQLALGRSLVETGDTKRGSELLSQVLKSDPDNLEAHLGMASLYSRTGQREDAYRERMVCLSLAK